MAPGTKFTASAPEALGEIRDRTDPRRAQVRGQHRWPTLSSSRGIGHRQKLHVPDQLAQSRPGERSSTLGFIRTNRLVSNASDRGLVADQSEFMALTSCS